MVGYPAASPRVLAVGGTRLLLDAEGRRTEPETAWIGSGGGIGQFVTEPGYQSAHPIPATGGRRGNPDVAYNADPDPGVAVYTSIPVIAGWVTVGGTSAGGPQWAGLVALANELRHILFTDQNNKIWNLVVTRHFIAGLTVGAGNAVSRTVISHPRSTSTVGLEYRLCGTENTGCQDGSNSVSGHSVGLNVLLGDAAVVTQPSDVAANSATNCNGTGVGKRDPATGLFLAGC